MKRLHTPRLAAAIVATVLTVSAVGTAVAGVRPTFSTTRPNGQGKVLIVGDSLTVGAATGGYRATNYLRDAVAATKASPTDAHTLWSGAIVDARVGRRIPAGRTIIAERIAADPSITAVVVALGTNDVTGSLPATPEERRAFWRSRIAGVLEAAAGRPVMWVNVEFGPQRPGWNARAAFFNAVLLRMAAEPAYAGRLVVRDWASRFPNTTRGEMRYTADGIHLNPGGYKFRADWMRVVMKWFGIAAVAATSTSSSITSSTDAAPPPP
ncbi:MAG: GDSL-like Lipase/Acylhydrolase family [Actinomycetota bacterium]|jgi:lysophospholipase L1-like esterase